MLCFPFALLVRKRIFSLGFREEYKKREGVSDEKKDADYGVGNSGIGDCFGG